MFKHELPIIYMLLAECCALLAVLICFGVDYAVVNQMCCLACSCTLCLCTAISLCHHLQRLRVSKNFVAS